MANNEQALALKALHKPGSPIVFANVYDGRTAKIVSGLPSSKAVATASYAIAESAGLEDPALTFEVNLAAIKTISRVVKSNGGKPLTSDIQDGYGDQLEHVIKSVIDAGVSGCNLEDFNGEQKKMYPLDEAVSRIKRAVAAATEAGVPDFVINARCDVLVHGGELSEVLERGKAYLAAGANTIFVWGGGKRGTSRGEIEKMVEAFNGRLNVRMLITPGALGVKELSEIGVARISVGPELQHSAMKAYQEEAEKLLTGGY